MKYDIDLMSFNELDEKAAVNTFQRRLVWSEKEKKEFITTLRNGYPFGAILIYKYHDGEKFSIIDGLQRFTTIKDFKNEPHKYITDLKHYVDEITEVLGIKNLNSNTISNYKRNIENSINSFFETKEIKYNTLYKIIKEKDLFNDIIHRVEADDIHEIQHNLVKFVNNYLEVDNIKIPCIEFKGDQTELATVFQNLNRGGKKLSKYQVFAAQWSRYKTTLDTNKYNDKLLEKVIERYIQLQDSTSVDILDFDENQMRKDRKITLSEFCYALGILILDRIDVFVTPKNKRSEDLANEIGYSTLAIVLNVSNNKIQEIIDKKVFFEDAGKIETLVSNVLDEYSIINNYFKQYLKIPGYKSERYESSAVTNFQILSFFATLWSEKYQYSEPDGIVREKQGYKGRYKQSIDNFIYYLINDLVTSRWSGTGDSKLNDIYINNSNRYLTPIEEDDLRYALGNWNKESINKASINFTPITKLIYVVYISHYLGQHDAAAYEYEHIFPKKRYQADYLKETLPLGSLGNIMLLDKNINASKQDNHILKDRASIATLNDDFVRINNYPNTKILNRLNDDLTAKDYEQVRKELTNRASYNIESLLKELYNTKF